MPREENIRNGHNPQNFNYFHEKHMYGAMNFICNYKKFTFYFMLIKNLNADSSEAVAPILNYNVETNVIYMQHKNMQSKGFRLFSY